MTRTTITIDFEDRDEAERVFEAIEKLLHEMGQIGTLGMTTIGPSGAGDEFAWVPSWLSNPPTPTPAAERGAATLRKLLTPKEP